MCRVLIIIHINWNMSHLQYLPVMSSWAEALAGQHTHHPIEALRLVRHQLVAVAAVHLLPVHWDHETWVGCVVVQSDGGFEMEGQRVTDGGISKKKDLHLEYGETAEAKMF